MAFWITNFEKYIDTWLETNFPANFEFFTFHGKINQSLKHHTFAKINDDSALGWFEKNQPKYQYTIHKELYFVKLSSKGHWVKNYKHFKHLGEYYIEPEQEETFKQEYYWIKKTTCNRFFKKHSKETMIKNLYLDDEHNLCFFFDNISKKDLMFVKMSMPENGHLIS